MPIDYVEQIIEIAGIKNPVNSPKNKDWEIMENDFGLIFPQDYRDLVTHLGEGEFGVGLCFRSPIDRSEYNQLTPEAVVKHFDPVMDLKLIANMALYPEPFGAVAIGGIDRQDFLLRPDKTGKMLRELIWWDIDTGEVKELKMSVARFIHDLYLSKIDEGWATELSKYVWRNKTVPLFTQKI